MHWGLRKGAFRVTGLAIAVALSTALSAPAASASTISATEGAQFSGQVASVTVPCPAPTSPTATIDWGDGSSSAGQVTASGSELDVSGTHTYAEENSYTGNVSGTYLCSGDHQTFSAPFSAQVGDAPIGAYPDTKLKTDSSDSFGGTVASFGDIAAQSAADFTATIDWGDGSSSPGTINVHTCSTCISSFYVTGSHEYPSRSATYSVSVTIHDDGGQSATVTDTMVAATPPPCPLSGWGGRYAQPPYNTGLSYQISGAQPVLDSSGDPTGQSTETVWMGGLAFETPGCWYSVGDAGPPADPGQPYSPTVHFLTYSSVAINGVYFVPQSNDTVMVIGSDGSIVVENWCGLGAFRLRQADHRASDPCNTSTTYWVEVPQNLGQSGPLMIVGQVDLAKRPISDFLSGSLGSFGPAAGGPQIGNNRINPGATITVPGYPAQYQAQVNASINLPGLSLGPDSGGPATSQLNYYTQGPGPPGSNQGGGGGGGSGPENPCLAAHPPDCKNIPFQMRDRRSASRARVGRWETPVRPHLSPHGTNGGFSCPPAGLNASQTDAFLGGLGIQNLSLTCDASQAYPWTGTGTLDFSWLPGGAFLPSANFVFHLDQNGNFHDGYAELDSQSGIPVFATPPVDLTHLGIGISTNPTTFYGEANLNVLEGLLQVDGHVLIVNADEAHKYTYPGCQPHWPCPPLQGVTKLLTNTQADPISTFAAGLSGTITLELPVIGPTQLGGAYVFYVYPAYFEFGACLGPPVSGQSEGPGINCQGLSFLNGFITVNGKVQGAADMKLGQYDVSGNLDVNANFPDPIGSIGVFLGAEVSNVGMGACGGISTPFGNVDGYVWLKWDGDHSIGLGGCDNNWPIHVNVQRSRARDASGGHAAQAGGSGTINLKPELSSASLTVDGDGAPPRVTVTGPDGSQLSNPTPGQGAAAHDVMILPIAQLNETLIWLKRPAGGRWTITGLPGSPAVTGLSYSTPLPPASIGTTVTAARGGYTLHYDLRDPPGRTVTFIEQSRGGVYHVLGRAHGSRGTLRFTPALGPAGTRRITALISINGLPVRAVMVGRYAAPPLPRAGTSRRVRITRSRRALLVTWSGAPRAAGYLVTAELTDGRHLSLALRPNRHAWSIRTLGPGSGAQVRVYAVGPTGILGRPALARLAPPPPPGRVRGIVVRRTRRGLVISWRRSPRALRYLLQITIRGSRRATLYGFTDRPTLTPKDASLMLQRGDVSQIAIAAVSLEGQVGPAGTLRYAPTQARPGRRRGRGRELDLFE